MANVPQSSKSLLQNRRDRLVAQRVRTTKRPEQEALEREIGEVDRLIALESSGGRVPMQAPPLEPSHTPTNKPPKPKTISARTQAKKAATPPAAPIDTPVQAVSLTQPISPAGEVQPSPESQLEQQYAQELGTPAPAIPAVDDLDYATRVALAVGGAYNPQFFESVVAPQIQARNPTPLQQQQLQANAEEIKSQKLGQIRAQGELQRNTLDREQFDYAKAKDQASLHTGFSQLAGSFFGPQAQGGGKIDQLKDLAQQLAATGRPDLQTRAKQMLGQAALMSGLMWADNDVRKKHGLPEQPVTNADLLAFKGMDEDADKLLAAAYNDLDLMYRFKEQREMINKQQWDLKMHATLPVVNEYSENLTVLNTLTQVASLVKEGYLGVADSMASEQMAKYHIADETLWRRNNNKARSLRDLAGTIILTGLLGKTIPAGEAKFAAGIFMDDSSSEEQILSAINAVTPMITQKVQLLEGQFRFRNNLGGPPPANVDPHSSELGWIPDDDPLLNSVNQ